MFLHFVQSLIPPFVLSLTKTPKIGTRSDRPPNFRIGPIDAAFSPARARESGLRPGTSVFKSGDRDWRGNKG